MKKITALFLMLAGAAIADTVNVSIQNFKFSPDTAKIVVDDVIRWTNLDQFHHTSTSTLAIQSWDSGDMANGATYAHPFTQVGTDNYRCTVHPSMIAVVVVKNKDKVERTVKPASPVFELTGAAPNPFRGITEFQFSLPRSGRVEISIHSADGRRVFFESHVFPAGVNAFAWKAVGAGSAHHSQGEARALPAGRYVARFTFEKTVQTLPLTLTE